MTDLVDGQLALPQGIKNRDSQRVSQCFEKVRFEVAQLLSHSELALLAVLRELSRTRRYAYLHILAYSRVIAARPSKSFIRLRNILWISSDESANDSPIRKANARRAVKRVFQSPSEEPLFREA